MMTTRQRSLTLLTVALATFMTYLDNNIVNVAIPDIRASLHLTAAGLEWVVSAYVLVFAGLLLVGGRLADAFGRRRLLVLGLVVFTASSLAAGLAGTATELIAARAVQGLGAAMVTPTTLAIIAVTYPDTKERARAVAIWSAIGALALAVGPLLGGILSQHVSWSWIFFVNVPVGVVTIALAQTVVPESSAGETRSLDLPGLSLSAAGLTALTWALIEGGSRGWTSSPILVAFALAVAAITAFATVEARSKEPMVDVALFRDRVFSGGIVALMLWAFGLFGIYFFTSLYLQDVLRFSPTKAGIAFVPLAASLIVGAGVSEALATRLGAYRIVGGALLAMGAGIASVALLGASAHLVDLMPSFVVIGVAAGLTTPLTSAVLAAMPAQRVGVASGVFNASRELAGLLGITVIGAVIALKAPGSEAFTPAAFLSGYRLGLLVAGALVAVGGAAAYVSLRSPRVADSPEYVLAG
jgi:EmrB/QacA subfamily drug resistance transporter